MKLTVSFYNVNRSVDLLRIKIKLFLDKIFFLIKRSWPIKKSNEYFFRKVFIKIPKFQQWPFFLPIIAKYISCTLKDIYVQNVTKIQLGNLHFDFLISKIIWNIFCLFWQKMSFQAVRLQILSTFCKIKNIFFL